MIPQTHMCMLSRTKVATPHAMDANGQRTQRPNCAFGLKCPCGTMVSSRHFLFPYYLRLGFSMVVVCCALATAYLLEASATKEV